MGDSTNNSARALAQSSNPVKVENISIPGFGMSSGNGEFDTSQYKVRYLKVDFDDESLVGTLEQLETEGLGGVETVILNKTGWTFMDKYLMIVTYLEKRQ